jgi:hypothetical protein
MTEDTGNPRANRPKNRMARSIGGGLGALVGLTLGKLIGFLTGFESFWLGLVLVGGCVGIGGFLARKIASE